MAMGKQAILILLRGSFEQGFPVILRIRKDGAAETEIEVEGHLPPALDILEPFRNWQSAYCNWQSNYRQSLILQERIIPRPNAVTNVSWIELSSQMKECLNSWLNSSSQEWRKIRDQLLRNLSETDDEIQVLIQTNDVLLRQLPWNLWDLFSEQYTNAEIALSLPAFKQLRHRSLPVTSNVRVLAILGDTTNIDIQQDRTILEQLPQAQIEFLEEPTREQLNRQLWEKHWDILFFAGHSDSYENGELGRIYINQNDCLTLDELGNALRTGIEKGLKLAIFNSCDGLGLAHRLATWGLPQSIVMRQPVPDLVAQEFLKNFLEAFAGRRSLYLAVREAREKLQGLERDFPYASWLPVICQNPAAKPLSWSQPVQGSILEPAVITPNEPKPHPPRQPQAYRVIFKYFIIFLIGASIGLMIANIRSPENISISQACKLPAADVSEIAFSPDGKYLAQASLDKTVRVFEVKETSHKRIYCQEYKDGVVAVKFSPDGKKIATASFDSTAGLIEIIDQDSISSFVLQHTYQRPVVSLNFSSDGKYLAAGSADTEGIVKIWDTKNRKEIVPPLKVNNSVFVRAVSFSRDGKYLAIASLNNKAQVWNWKADKDGQKLISLPLEDVVNVIFSPKDNHVLLTASADGIIQVWNMSNEPQEITPQLNLNTSIMKVSFSPDGKHIATTSCLYQYNIRMR
jgi:hypothetical protein